MTWPSGILSTLHVTGHRLTPQRELVFEAIAESHGHVTAEQLLEQLRARYPHLNKSAVYRALDLLTRLDLITQTDCGHGRIEYEMHRRPHHHHLICRACGKMEEVDQVSFVSLKKSLQSRYGFQADLDHFAIFGSCRSCQAKVRKTISTHGVMS